jgi:hypothetical protein
LFFGQCYALNVCATDLGQVTSKPTPTGADIEHVLSWLDQQFRGEVSFLRKLGIIE